MMKGREFASIEGREMKKISKESRGLVNRLKRWKGENNCEDEMVIKYWRGEE